MEVSIKSGSITVDSSSRVRRRGNLTIEGDSSVYELVAAPGAIFSIESGLNLGTSEETVPLFYGEATSPAQKWGDGTIDLSLADLGNKLSRCRFLTPYAPASSVARTSAISTVVQGAMPTAEVYNESTDVGTIGAKQVWAENRLDLITDLTKDGGTEAFFRADGTFVVRDQKSLTAPPVWTLKAGTGGTMKQAERTRPSDRMYNTVIVRPSASDGSQTWTQKTATIADTSHPWYSGKVGVVPYFWASPTITTGAAAQTAADRIRDRITGVAETLTLESIANPALEAGDVIRVITPTINSESAKIFQHFIDSYTIDLNSGSMTLATRSQVIADD